MVSSKQQVLLLDQTKTVAECAQQLLYAAKESGGNPKAQHIHGDIDESVDSMTTSINELVGTIAKLAPNLGVVSRMVNCITEAIYTVEDYRPGSRGAGDESDHGGFVTYQSRMMSATKEIARTGNSLIVLAFYYIGTSAFRLLHYFSVNMYLLFTLFPSLILFSPRHRHQIHQ